MLASVYVKGVLEGGPAIDDFRVPDDIGYRWDDWPH
jgi:hypothetical protein